MPLNRSDAGTQGAQLPISFYKLFGRTGGGLLYGGWHYSNYPDCYAAAKRMEARGIYPNWLIRREADNVIIAQRKEVQS